MTTAAMVSVMAAARANAIKASGVIVRIDPSNFMSLLRRTKNPLIVYAKGGFFSANHQYLMSYKGLAFYTKVSNPIPLSADAEVIVAEKISIPE